MEIKEIADKGMEGDAQAKEAADDMEGQYNAAKLALNNVLANYPAAGDDVRRIFDKLELAHGIAASAVR